jgi:hypothetical protein
MFPLLLIERDSGTAIKMSPLNFSLDLSKLAVYTNIWQHWFCSWFFLVLVYWTPFHLVMDCNYSSIANIRKYKYTVYSIRREIDKNACVQSIFSTIGKKCKTSFGAITVFKKGNFPLRLIFFMSHHVIIIFMISLIFLIIGRIWGQSCA